MRLLIEYALAENKRASRWERLFGIEIFTILRLKVRAIIVNSHFEVLWLNQRGFSSVTKHPLKIESTAGQYFQRQATAGCFAVF